MPLVAHTDHPSYRVLQDRGHEILPMDRALSQDIRELHVGLLNMMPDAALSSTDQQFMRLIGSCNKIVQFYVHPFTIPGLARSSAAQTYIDDFYDEFDLLREVGLDALIITGANVTNSNLNMETFWEPLQEVIGWATNNVTSILCSCLATHALVSHLYKVKRYPLPQKIWGVYSHRVKNRLHPLLQDINTRFDVPHSRWNEVRRADLTAAGLIILVESDDAGVHLAVSPDQFRIVYFQGHPEYDRITLLKEYKREVLRFINWRSRYHLRTQRIFSRARLCGLQIRILIKPCRLKKMVAQSPNFRNRRSNLIWTTPGGIQLNRSLTIGLVWYTS